MPPSLHPLPFVIPAQAGTHGRGAMHGSATRRRLAIMGPGLRRDDEQDWVPQFLPRQGEGDRSASAEWWRGR
ncbi:MAG: hypothetical protein EOP65_14100, partial [Sphingomonas sp.]